MLSAFTLLELLLVIAIIAVLAGIIMFALKPSDRLQQANQVKVLANANDLEKAFNNYLLDNGGVLPSAFNSLTFGYYDICKTSANGCVSLSELVPKYLPSIPLDTRNSTTDTTGFKIKYDPTKKSALIFSNEEYLVESVSGATLTSGLVGYWKMDEVSWNGTTGEVIDSSGNNFNGTAINGTSVGNGKYSNGAYFDGVDDTINVGNLGTFNKATYSVWINMTKTHVWPISTSSVYGIILDYTNFRFRGFGIDQSSAATLNGGWKHIVVTADGQYVYYYVNGVNIAKFTQTSGSDALSNVKFGQRGDNIEFYGGSLDEVRIYNRALSQSEVTALYQYAPGPVGYWKFDEGGGISAFDSSGNENTGTAIGNPIRAVGKYGNAFSFNGSTQYINIVDSGTNILDLRNTFTLEAWVKASTTTSCGGAGTPLCIIFNKEDSYEWALNSTNTMEWAIANSNPGWAWINTGASSLSNEWTYLSLVYDGSSLYTYRNGVLIHTRASTIGNLALNDNDLRIGARGGDAAAFHFFPGMIDEVRIYNYVRTPEQIVRDMNNL